MGEDIWQSLGAFWEWLGAMLTPEGWSVLLGSLALLVVFPMLGYGVFFQLPRKGFQWWEHLRLLVRRRRRVLLEIGFVTALVLFFAYPMTLVEVSLLFLILLPAAFIVYRYINNESIPETLARVSARVRTIYEIRRWLFASLAFIVMLTISAIILALISNLFPPYVNFVALFVSFAVIFIIWHIWEWEELSREDRRRDLPGELIKYDFRFVGVMAAAALPALFLLFFYQFSRAGMQGHFFVAKGASNVWVSYLIHLFMERFGIPIKEPSAVPVDFVGHAAQLGFTVIFFFIVVETYRKLMAIWRTRRRADLSDWWVNLSPDDPTNYDHHEKSDVRNPNLDLAEFREAHSQPGKQFAQEDEYVPPWRVFEPERAAKQHATEVGYLRIKRALIFEEPGDAERAAKAAAALRNSKAIPLLVDLVVNRTQLHAARKAGFDALVAILRNNKPSPLRRLRLRQSMSPSKVLNFLSKQNTETAIQAIAEYCAMAYRPGKSAPPEPEKAVEFLLSLLSSGNDKDRAFDFALAAAIVNLSDRANRDGEDKIGKIVRREDHIRLLGSILEDTQRDRAVLVSAAYVAAIFRLKDEEIASALKKTLNDESGPDLYNAAIEWLITSEPENAAEKLRTASRNSKWPTVRLLATAGLGRIRVSDEESIGHLKKILESLYELPNLRAMAAYTLGEIGASGACDSLFRLFRTREYPKVRAAAAWAWLKAYNDPPPSEVFEKFTEALREPLEDDTVRIDIAEGLREYAKKKMENFQAKLPEELKAAIGSVIEATYDKNPKVIEWSVRTLGWIGAMEAKDHLIRKLAHASPDVRGHAAWALGMIMWRIDRDEISPSSLRVSVLEALSRRLERRLSKDGDKDVRSLSAWALGTTIDVALNISKKTGHVLNFQSGFLRETTSTLITALRKDRNNDAGKDAAWALGKPGNTRAVKPLIDVLRKPRKDDNSAVRVAAAGALGTIGDPRAVEPLIAVLQKKDDDASVRWAAASALGAIKDPRAVEPLIAVLRKKDDDASVRWAAAFALGAIKDPRAVEPLIAVLQKKDDDTFVRWAAAFALGAIKDPRAVEPLIAVLQKKDDDAFVRWAAAFALGAIKDPRAVEPLIAVLRTDTEWSVRAAAARALGKIGGDEVKAALESALQHETNEDVEKAIKDAIEQIANASQTGTRTLAAAPDPYSHVYEYLAMARQAPVS